MNTFITTHKYTHTADTDACIVYWHILIVGNEYIDRYNIDI